MAACTIAEALKSPDGVARLTAVPGPGGVVADVLDGRAGRFVNHDRTLIYLKRGRAVCWFVWRVKQLELFE